jgi:2-oxo-4-hydroxy-4-carboxy--5-ureidoimidazoline (OHCU) decarboxylase
VTLTELNRLNRVAFVAALAGIYEHSPWVPDRAWLQRPFTRLDDLRAAMATVVAAAGKEQQVALIRAHPELAGKAMAER